MIVGKTQRNATVKIRFQSGTGHSTVALPFNRMTGLFGQFLWQLA